MKLGLALAIVLAGCSVSEQQVEQALEKNPDLVLKAIEKRPEQFMQVINNVAKKAQEAERFRRVSEMKALQEEQMKNPLKPKLDPSRRLITSKDAKVVVVEYGDFECPACRVASQTMKVIKEKYAGKIDFYFKNMPLNFHPNAMQAARYFEALSSIDKTKALQFYDQVFDNQKGMGSPQYFEKMVRGLNGDLKKIKTLASSPEIQSRIQEDMKEFEALGFDGTPVILVNGVALYGAPSVETVEQLIQRQISATTL